VGRVYLIAMTGNKNSESASKDSEISIAQKQIKGGDMLYAAQSLEEGSRVVSVESSGTRYVLYSGELISFNDYGFEIQDSELAGMEDRKSDAKQLAQDKIQKHGESQN